MIMPLLEEAMRVTCSSPYEYKLHIFPHSGICFHSVASPKHQSDHDLREGQAKTLTLKPIALLRLVLPHEAANTDKYLDSGACSLQYSDGRPFDTDPVIIIFGPEARASSPQPAAVRVPAFGELCPLP